MEMIKILGDWTRLSFKNSSGPKTLRYSLSLGVGIFFFPLSFPFILSS